MYLLWGGGLCDMCVVLCDACGVLCCALAWVDVNGSDTLGLYGGGLSWGWAGFGPDGIWFGLRCIGLIDLVVCVSLCLNCFVLLKLRHDRFD